MAGVRLRVSNAATSHQPLVHSLFTPGENLLTCSAPSSDTILNGQWSPVHPDTGLPHQKGDSILRLHSATLWLP